MLLYLVFTEMLLLSMQICVCLPPLNLFINVKLCAAYAIDVFQYCVLMVGSDSFI